MREAYQIMPAELDNYIGLFLLSIRKGDGSEYEPDTLTSYHRGIDRYLKENKYPHSIIQDKEFASSRTVLASKRKELKEKGKGNHPNASEPISTQEKKIILEKGLLGLNTPETLLNTLWLNNTTLFGIRGCSENHNLRWGDIKLKKTDSGIEYLKYNERLTKTRTAAAKTETRAFPPKQFAHENTDTCPVHAYKVFALRRPKAMLESDSPFYLQINPQRLPTSQIWYKNQAMGVNYLANIMRSMAEKADLQGRKTNHSARKTTCTKLLHQGVAPTVIQQLTGHKNTQSVNNYAKESLEQQQIMSDIISDNPNLNMRQVATAHRSNSASGSAMQVSGQYTHTSQINQAHVSHNVMSETSLFPGQLLQNARLMNCSITVNNYGSDTPTAQPKPKRRRIRIFDSDSD